MKINLSFLVFFFSIFSFAQTGISVSPPRLYFEAGPGESATQKVMVTNVSTSYTMDLSVSLGDWKYDDKGENMMFPPESLETSCAGWVMIKDQDAYFSLKPGEQKELEVNMTTPSALSKTPVHTTILYVTQMNPTDDVDSRGANIKVSIRSGIKLFHRTHEAKNRKLEIQNLKYAKDHKAISLYFENKGNIWTDGLVYPEFFNTQTGKKIKMESVAFYTMPGDQRQMDFALPQDLVPGDYIATILMEYGDDQTMEMAELSFSYE